MTNQKELEDLLDSFDPAARRQALVALAGAHRNPAPAGSNVNMHFHSFFSYNSRGYSPSHIAWDAHKAGLYAAGLCDFDVLDGLDEFLAAGLVLGLRTTVNLETRAYLREFADAEINSPGEPGVTYIMGAGFARRVQAHSAQAATLAAYRDQARQRNVALVRRINPHMGPAAIDYDRDVVPLSPGNCPTERHIVRAYLNRSRAVFPLEADGVKFWAGILGRPAEEVSRTLSNAPAAEEKIRSRLAKQGGVGYEPPTAATFPPVDDFIAWVLSCDAIPMATWLDGLSRGESNPATMLECLRAKGAAAVNIIPDRNWNLKDPAAKAAKTAKLKEFVETAVRMQMPINIGTEMNKDGLPFVDDLSGEALRPYRDCFVAGACVFVGHTCCARYAGLSYVGAAAEAEFGRAAGARNRFFEAVGRLPPLTERMAKRLEDAGPQAAQSLIRDSVGRGEWRD